jgi:hypothetical protein
MIPAPPRAAPPPVPLTLAKLLLVEGQTPLHFCEALLRELGLSDQVEVRSFGGVTQLRAQLAALVASPEFARLVTAVGVVRDAEGNATGARNSVETAFQTVAATYPHFGLVARSCHILPNDHDPGNIEDLCLASLTAEPVFACVDAFFDCAKQAGVTFPAAGVPAKSRVQAFLATRPDVQLFPGQAAYRNYFAWDSPAFDGLKAFLRNL